MEFEAGEMVKGDRGHGRVFGEDGLAGRVTAGDNAADVHGGSLNGMREGYNRFEGFNTETMEEDQRTPRKKDFHPQR